MSGVYKAPGTCGAGAREHVLHKKALLAIRQEGSKFQSFKAGQSLPSLRRGMSLGVLPSFRVTLVYLDPKIQLVSGSTWDSPENGKDLGLTSLCFHPPSGLILRKEVIQPHLPIRLPCYDFVPLAPHTFGG